MIIPKLIDEVVNLVDNQIFYYVSLIKNFYLIPKEILTFNYGDTSKIFSNF